MSMRMLTGLLTVLLCGLAVEAGAQGMVRVSAERTSLRDAAATSGAVVAPLVRGEELTVLERSGSWYRVRTKSGVEGFVSSLLVEVIAGSAPAAPAAAPAAAAPAPAPAAAPPAPAPAPQRAPVSTASQSSASSGGGSDHRTFGVGAGTGGVSYGLTPSMRYWFSEQVGLEVNVAFLGVYDDSLTAISPSVIVKFGDGWQAGPVQFKLYAGGGLTYYHWSNDVFGDAGHTGFGGFGGVEVGFDAVPRLTVSASAGVYGSPGTFNYGALYQSVLAHWYFK